MDVKTISEIYYDDLKTGIYKVFDLEENLRFNLGVGLVYIIHLDSDITNKPYSYQLAVKDDNVFFRTNEDINNLRFIPTNIKIESDTNNFIKINVNQIESNLRNYFEELKIKEINIRKNGELKLEYFENDEISNVNSPFRLNEKSEHLNNHKFNTDIKTDNSSFKNPFRSLDIGDSKISPMNSTDQEVINPFRIESKNSYNQIAEAAKHSNQVYIIKENNQIDEVITILKYILVDFRKSDNTLYKTLRVIKNTVLDQNDFPENEEVMKPGVSNTKEYEKYNKWVDSSGNEVRVAYATEDMEVFASGDKYTATIETRLTKLKSGNLVNQSSYKIISDKRIYLKEQNYMGHRIVPTVTVRNSNQKNEHNVSFRIPTLSYNSGTTTRFNMRFNLYEDIGCTKKILDVDTKILVTHETEQSGGD